MADVVKVFALGGLDEYGKNHLVVEINDNIFVLSSGVKFPDKMTPGIDYIITNTKYLEDNKDRVKAYILLHGHDDEVGSIAFYYDKVKAPIYCSEVTKIMLQNFSNHVMRKNKYDFRIIEPTSDELIAGIKFHFFHTCHNIADSSGVAIETSLGNIIYTSDFIIDNNSDPLYLCDLNALGRIKEKPTLLLMCDSQYSERSDYTSPNHKILHSVGKELEDAKGRLFSIVFTPNAYNLNEVFELAQSTGRRIVCYDQETEQDLNTFLAASGKNFKKTSILPRQDVLRISEKEVLIIITGYGERLYDKVIALANNANLNDYIKVKPTDTVLFAAPSNLNTEVVATEALNEIYKTGANIIHLNSKKLWMMHPSEEDIKMMISLTNPRYFFPVKGTYKQLLASAMIANKMGGSLNYSSIFVVDNGDVITFSDKGANISQNVIPTGDVYIDGYGIADANSTQIAERQNLGGDGVVIMGISISRSERKIVAGPDIQMRGFVFLSNADDILKILTNVMLTTVEEYLEKPYANMLEARQIIYENSLKELRKETGKSPMIIPTIIELD